MDRTDDVCSFGQFVERGDAITPGRTTTPSAQTSCGSVAGSVPTVIGPAFVGSLNMPTGHTLF